MVSLDYDRYKEIKYHVLPSIGMKDKIGNVRAMCFDCRRFPLPRPPILQFIGLVAIERGLLSYDWYGLRSTFATVFVQTICEFF